MSQEQKQKSKVAEETTETVEAKDVSNEELDSAVEDILDEIDDVLESNAEEFVAGFVQKGGE